MLLRHDAAVVSGHFSHDGSQLVTATTNDGITVWDVASGVPLRTYPCAGNGVNDALLLPGGRQLFEAGVAFGASALVDLQTERETTTFAMIQAECAVWVPPGRGILIASWDGDAPLRGAAQLLDQDDLHIQCTYRTGIAGPIGRIAVSRDGARFLAAQQYFTVETVETVATSADAAFLFETDTGAILRRYDGPATIDDIVFAPNERQVIAGGESGLWWWDTQTAAVLGQMQSPYSPLTSLASVSASVGDSQELAGGSEDGAVVVWRWPDLREICRFHEHTGRVNQVAFAPNAPLVASASEGTTVSLHSLDR
jgi:WD40 repeat protein